MNAGRPELFLWDAERVGATVTNLTLPGTPADEAPSIVDLAPEARAFLIASRERAAATARTGLQPRRARPGHRQLGQDRNLVGHHPPLQTTPARPPLSAHARGVEGVAFSPNGHTLATGGADNTVILWDVADPTRPRRRGPPLNGYTLDVHSVAFSPDGRTLATASADNKVVLWNVSHPARPRRLGRPFTGHAESVRPVAFSPDGRILAVAGSDSIYSGVGNHSVILWDVTDPATPRKYSPPLTGHKSPIHAMAFKPGGRSWPARTRAAQ
ncbi:hypothetical protein [Nonomuraea lactucae]|uniref:WD40 repeat domain-containing protein n=1 Tax=Nonomuraea lactucae TaxID=2249762 RepID=UPI00308415CE